MHPYKITSPSWLAIGLSLAISMGGCTRSSSPSAGLGSQSCDTRHWVGAWTAAQQASSLLSGSGLAVQEFEADVLANQTIFPNLSQAQVFNDQTLRLIVTPHLGSDSIRLHFSNRFQSQPVSIDRVFVGVSASGATLVEGSNTPVTFNGSTSASIASGQEVISDPISITTAPFEPLGVSIHISGLAVAVDYHLTAQQVSYMAYIPGSFGASEDGSMFSTTLSAWYLLSAVDVMTSGKTTALVALGDSITDGYLSSYNTNSRWPDFLARRYLLASDQPKISVVEAGISGNYVASDNYIFGPSAVNRFEKDVQSVAGVTDVLLFEGINDIGGSPTDPSTSNTIISAYKAIIAKAHSAGIRIYGATLTPALGAKSSAVGLPGEPQTLRQNVNNWIRTSGAFDGFFDFDAAVRDPNNPDHLADHYDGGDNLHLSDAGYQALANAVDLGAIVGNSCP